MGDIEYATPNSSWNPVTGCTPVSEECQHCWAKSMARRLAGRFGYPPGDGFSVTLHPDKLDIPLRWRKPRRIPVCFMGDLFHEAVPFEYIAACYGIMAAAHWHTHLVLTKRIHRALEFYRWIEDNPRPPCRVAASSYVGRPVESEPYGRAWPLPNVVLMTTAGTQKRADERIPLLLQCPAAVHGVSLEPLLERVDFRKVPGFNRVGLVLSKWWIVAGAESGPGARDMDEDWVRSIRDQCVSAGVPFYYKQRLENGRKVSHPLLDGVRWQQLPRTGGTP